MRDVAVDGGGHNGLVCAACKAMAGLDAEVLEANALAGGCLRTERLDTRQRLEVGAIDLSGIPGRNTARALLSDLGSHPPRSHRILSEIKGLRAAWSLYRSMRKRT